MNDLIALAIGLGYLLWPFILLYVIVAIISAAWHANVPPRSPQ